MSGVAVGGRTVLVTGTSLVGREALQLIESRGFAVRRLAQDEITGAELHAALRGVSGYVIGGYEEPEPEHFDGAALLEAVAFVGADFRAAVPGWSRAFELGTALACTPGANADSVAEFAALLMLSLARPIIGSVARPGPDGLEAPESMGPPALELRGLTLGVIGPGRIGTRMATIASEGLGMHVLYTAPRRNDVFESAVRARFLPKRELLAASDVVTLHRPGPARGAEPEIGRVELDLMREGAMLVNTGHPDLVDPVALRHAIEVRRIRAASDGLRRTPAWRSLVELGPDRFLCLPQSGFHTEAANLRASLRAAEAVCSVLDGADVVHPDIQNPGYRAVRRAAGRPGAAQ